MTFCEGYTPVFERDDEFANLHPDTRAEIDQNNLDCTSLCPEKCPLIEAE